MRLMIAFSDQCLLGRAGGLIALPQVGINRLTYEFVGRISMTRRSTIKLQMPLGHIAGLAACLLVGLGSASGQQGRPAITGVSHMCVYASDAAATDHFYAHNLGATKGPDPQNPE